MYFFTVALRSVESLRTAAVFYDGRCQRATAPVIDQSEKRLYAIESGGKPVEEMDRVLLEMVGRIREAVRPERIILFGSHARGEGSRGSDVDLLIVAPSGLPRWRRTPSIYRLLAGLGVPKDVLWWTPEEIEEWRGVRSHFINTVLREGKVLYERPA